MTDTTKKKTKKTIKEDNIQRNWYLIDAKDKTLGRLSTKIAGILMGKTKAVFSRDTDKGDFVVVINAEKVRVTGKKAEDKKYYTHSGYQGGLKVISFKDLIKKNPASVLEHAVNGMLPKNKLRNNRMKRLKAYAGDLHPHKAQKLETIELLG